MSIFDSNGKLKVSGLGSGTSSSGGISVVSSLPASPTAGQLVSLNSIVYWYDGTVWRIIEEDFPNPYSVFGSSLALWLDWQSITSDYDAFQDWLDKSVNTNDASQASSVLQPSISRFGARFDGTSQYMTIPDHTTLDALTNLTVAISLTPDIATGNVCPISKSATGSGAWSIQTSTDGLRFHCGTPGVNFGEASLVLAADVTGNYIWVYDGTQTGNSNRLKLYLNGIEQTLSFTGTIPSTLTNTTDAITLGAYSNPSQYFDGSIHSVAISLTSITQAQVTELNKYLQNSKLPVLDGNTTRPSGFYTTASTAFYRSANGIAPGADDFIAIVLVTPTTNRSSSTVQPIISNKSLGSNLGWALGWFYGPLVFDIYDAVDGVLEASVASTAYSFDVNKGKAHAVGIRVRTESGPELVTEIWIGGAIFASANRANGNVSPSTGTPLDIGGGAFFGDEAGPNAYFLGAGYYEGRISEMEMTALMNYCQKFGVIPERALVWTNLYLGNNVGNLPTTWTDSGLATVNGPLTKQGAPTGVDSFFGF